MIQLNSIIRDDIKANVQNFEYLINIDNQVYVATRKQMLITDTNEDLYFEDVGMKITDLSEKIDLKTKKTQLGNSTITFANFNVYKGGKEKKFSDQFGELVGKNLKIYFKTQSCKTLSECLLVAQLKITRIKHDDKKITISANDLSIDTTFKEIPDNNYVLLKDINTFDHYSLKPVPTLYGHLENAPAIVYKEEESDSFIIKLLPDTSYFDGSEIGGVATFNTDGSQSIILDDGENLITSNKLELARQNVVKIGLGDQLCDVPCLPYIQTREEIADADEGVTHKNPQWASVYNHVALNYDIGNVNQDEVVENSTLWCSINEKPIKTETLSYNIEGYNGAGSDNGGWFYGTFDEVDFDETKTMMLEREYQSFGQLGRRYTIGVQRFTIKPLTGHEVNDKEDIDGNLLAKTDIHYIGALGLKQIVNYGIAQGAWTNHAETRIYSVFSAPLKDDNANVIAIPNNSNQSDYFWTGNHIPNVGFPSSFKGEMGLLQERDVEKLESFSLNKLTARGASDLFISAYEYSLDWDDYINSWVQSGQNNFKSNFNSDNEGLYTPVDSNILTLYYSTNPYSIYNYQYNTNPDVHLNIEPSWRDLEIRKVWSNKEIFEKDFFVNAKGKLGDVEPNIKNINGNIVVKYEGINLPTSVDDEGTNNLHFTELYKYLSNSEYKRKYIEGESYDLMLVSYNPTNDEYTYIYDVEVEDFKFMNDSLPFLLGQNNTYFWLNDGSYVQHNHGWVVRYNAKLFGNSQYVNANNNFLSGVRLVYAKKIYENENIVSIQTYDQEDLLETFNLNNKYDFGDYYTYDFPAYATRGYTQVSWNEELESKKLIERPHEIIQHLLSDENAAINFDLDKINTIYEQTPEYRLAFSINKRENTSKIIQKICQQSPIYYRYRGRDRKIVVDMMKNNYNDTDLSGVIQVNKLIKFSYDKTKIEDTCVGGVIVNYAYNYSTKNYDKRTPKRDTGIYRTDYAQYYGIDDLKGYEVEIDAPYIQDKATAELYRDYYFELNKQQKLTCKFELAIADGIEYEVGDIIKFDGNPNNTQPYGMDLTINNEIIDQESTPYFFITKVQKSLFRVKIECVQTHDLKYDLPQVSLLGDINLDGQITTGSEIGSDLFLLLEMVGVLTEEKTYEQLQEEGWTLQQIVNADMNQDGIVGYEDVILFTEEFGGTLA